MRRIDSTIGQLTYEFWSRSKGEQGVYAPPSQNKSNIERQVLAQMEEKAHSTLRLKLEKLFSKLLSKRKLMGLLREDHRRNITSMRHESGISTTSNPKP